MSSHTDQDFDFSENMKARSDQVNADDLIGGSITAQIIGSRRGGAEQPVVFRLSGGHQAWKPCKTMLRLVAECVGGTSTRLVVGRWVTLYRDSEVTFGQKGGGLQKVGGVRMSHMSGLDRKVVISLAIRKGQKATYTVLPLKDPEPDGAPTANLEKVLEDANLTIADFDRWGATMDKPPIDEQADNVKADVAVFLVNNPGKLDEIRALRDAGPSEDNESEHQRGD